ncbi:glycosyltransferase [Denitromonas sp.]|uniref:glycosyltransferase n=1 Tax=Denitromonas sp. TaxID=2734609 RepID=UPI002AFFAAAB|nr:glycosyltransferase [Denitromonas sp.]
MLSGILRALEVYPETVCLLDSRMILPEGMPENLAIRRVPPTLFHRLSAEKWLARMAMPGDTVFCFGNLPPLFRLSARCVVFLQNRYLVDDADLTAFPLWVRWRLAVERLWLSARMSNVDEFIVQTPTMQGLLMRRSSGRATVRMLPFSAKSGGYSRGATVSRSSENKVYDFIYVATGDPHKNHRCLFAAWSLLAEEGLFPSLCVTLDACRFASLCDEIESLIQLRAIKVSNVGELTHKEVLALYSKAAAVIYPSTFESFGLPLVEARQVGLPVLAAEADYVRDVLDPEQSFDPGSPLSIARAVKRHMGLDEPALPLLNAARFLHRVVGRDE